MRSNLLPLVLLIAVCSVGIVFTTSYPPEFIKQVQGYPDIITESRSKCAPIKGNYNSLESNVCDPDKLLTVDDINSLNFRIAEIKSSINKDSIGPCDPDKPKPSIAIALVNDMKIGDKKSDEILNYASVFTYYLFEDWKLSTPCNSPTDKIIIFYSKKDGSLYTFAGTLLNQRLNAKTITRVAVASKPFFSSNIVSGLKFVLDKYKNIFMGRDKGFL